MKIEKINDIFVMFNGEKFRKDKRTGYYWTTAIPRKSLHLSVFEFYGGVRPDEFELHHLDFDKENNNVENIICISKKYHKKIHTDHRREKYNGKWNEDNIKKAREGLKRWYNSDDYQEWKKRTLPKRIEDGRNSHNLRIKVNIVCEICGDVFQGYEARKRKICSGKCWAQHRRNSGKDNVEKKCVVCNNKFISNKFKKIETCSNHCRAILGYSNRGKNKKDHL